MKTEQVLERSAIAPLVPFISDGLIRARGRVRRAPELSFEQKHLIVLSSDHPVVKLFLRKVFRITFMKVLSFCGL